MSLKGDTENHSWGNHKIESSLAGRPRQPRLDPLDVHLEKVAGAAQKTTRPLKPQGTYRDPHLSKTPIDGRPQMDGALGTPSPLGKDGGSLRTDT